MWDSIYRGILISIREPIKALFRIAIAVTIFCIAFFGIVYGVELL